MPRLEFCIAETFFAAVARLQGHEQKLVKTTVYDLQENPAAPWFAFHRIVRSRDPHFGSIRVGSHLRIVIHKTEGSFLLAYVGHHEDAYAWAERRRIEAHPRTGAAQIVEVRERVEEAALWPAPARAPATQPRSVFAGLSAEDLLGVGGPEDWVADVLTATEDTFLVLADHLPAEAAEALLEYATSGRLQTPAPPIEMGRARRAVRAAGQDALELSERDEASGARIPIGTMHLAKILEVKAVVVMACDDDVLPLRSRVEGVADKVELDDV